jgi:hypothetical protein
MRIRYHRQYPRPKVRPTIRPSFIKITMMAIAATLAASCATANTSSQRSLDISPKPYGRVLVVAAMSDLDLRKDVELDLASAATDKGVEFVPAHTILLPGRQYTDAEFRHVLDKLRINAILIVNDRTTAAPDVNASAVSIPLPNGQTIVTGNRRIEQNNYTVASELWDVAQRKMVWVSTTHLTRNGAAREQLLDKLAGELVATLLDDKVLESRSRPQSTRHP